MKRISQLIIGPLILLFVIGCGGSRTMEIAGIADRELNSPPLPRRMELDRRVYSHFVNGSILEAMGEYYLASRQYAQALKLLPESEEIRYSYSVNLYRLKDYRSAIEEAEKIYPKDARDLMLIGDAYRALGIFDSSLSAYYQALARDSDLVNAYYFIAAYQQQQQNVDTVIWAYKNIARITNGYLAYQLLAGFQIQNGEIDEAKKNYDRSIELDSTSENVRSFIGLSAIYDESGDLPKAREYLEMAVARSPHDVLLLERLLDYYRQEKEFDKAIGTAETILSIEPEKRSAMRELGTIYIELDSLRLADSIFTDLLDRPEYSPLDTYYAGEIAFALEDYNRAKKYYSQLTVSADSVIDGWMNLAWAYRKQDSLVKAVDTYRTALGHMTRLKDSLTILFSLGAAYERIDSIDSAISIFEEVIRYKPDHHQALNYLGYMLADHDLRLDDAYRMIKKALELDPDNGAYIDSYGWVLYKMGEYDEALEQLLLASEKEGGDAVVLAHVGDAYMALGDREMAREFWQKALELEPGNEKLKEKLQR